MSEFACPTCGSDTKVARTHKSASTVRRQRQCKNPTEQHLFETTETALSEDLFVQRSWGDIEPFDRKNALERSIKLAAAGTLSDGSVSTIADNVILALNPRPRTPISTERIGQAVLSELSLKSMTAALRYATIFLSTRNIISTPAELSEWITKRIPTVHAAAGGGRPQWVTKRARMNRNTGWGEQFNLYKLWRGLEICTAGLRPIVDGKIDASWTSDEFVGAMTACILEDLHGQTLVTSGQISGASLRFLRAACPLAFVRYSIVAKGYDTREAFLDELQGLTDFPSSPIDLDRHRTKAQALAQEIGEIREMLSKGGLR